MRADDRIDLHDATLVSISLDWATGSTTIVFRPGQIPPGEVSLHAEGTRLLRLDRATPWGMSVSVNQVRGPEPASGGERVEIEMQSGDTIEVCGQSIKLSRRSAME